MKAFHFHRLLPILASLACAGELTQAEAEVPETFTAKAVVGILGPKEGLTAANFEKTQAAAQHIIASLLPIAEKRALLQMDLGPGDGLAITVNAVPDSSAFELHATAPSSRLAAEFANVTAGQIVQALPQADPAAVRQLELLSGEPPILLILEKAEPALITQVRP
jgi:hypothetical protein